MLARITPTSEFTLIVSLVAMEDPGGWREPKSKVRMDCGIFGIVAGPFALVDVGSRHW